MIGLADEDDDQLYPFPLLSSYVSSHQPKSIFHPARILKGRRPHAHIIKEDSSFDDKQALGNHMDAFHEPNGKLATSDDVVV